ncbi:MAG: hypothetical protein ACLGH3_00835 [Actinomycetota bacterium]
MLLVAWAAVLAPSFLGRRGNDGRAGFEETMGTLATTARAEAKLPGRWVMVPKGPRDKVATRRQRVVARRRAAFERLLVVAAATFVIALVPGLRAFFFAHLAADLALIGYAMWLKRERQKERAAARARVIAAREEERRRRLERQAMLDAQDEHISAALASNAPQAEESEPLRRASGEL